MKTLLRSTFVVRPEEDPEFFLRNAQALMDSGLVFEGTEDGVIWQFVRDFLTQHHHVPDASTLRNHFQHIQEDTVVDRVTELSVIPPKIRGNFLNYMEEKVQAFRTRETAEILKDAARILETGLTLRERGKDRILRGPAQAIQFILDKGHDIVMPSTGVHLSGDVTTDGDNFLAEYERIEADPLSGLGQLSGIGQMDMALRGARRNELWLHAAFTGGLKSTLATNWAYHQSVYYNHSCLYFSLEMPYIQIRRLLYAMHSRHEKFEAVRKSLGLGICIPYQKIRDGELDVYSEVQLARMKPEEKAKLLEGGMNPERPEKRFLTEYVIPDFNNPANNYGHIYIEVPDPNKADFTCVDLRAKAELLYSKDPTIRTVFIDHAGLMAPRHRMSSTTENLNQVLRDLKRLAMSFNRGTGIAVVALFQISREGFKSAEKNDGRYNLTHLSYSNEAEKCVLSTSIILERLKGYTKICEAQVGDRVWSSGGWKLVLDRFDNGIRRIWKTTTDRGSMLEATAPHRVRVIEDGHLGWKSVQSLTTEDFVAGAYGGKMPSKWPSLPALDFQHYEHRRDRLGKEIRVPCLMNSNLAYLMGAWDGDGAINRDGIGFTGNRQEIEIRDGLLRRLAESFGGACTVCESPSRPGSFDIRKFSRPLKRWFESLAGPRGLSVPEVIFQSPEEGVRAYLRGLFDTDGWFNKVGIVGINMKGAAEGFLRDVQMLLTGLGIDSHLSFCNPLSKQTGKRYPKVSLRVRSRRGVQVFAEKIGFTDSTRQERLLEWVQTRRAGSRRGDVQVYPTPETFIRVYRLVHPPGTAQNRFDRSFYNLPARVKRTGLVPRGAVETLLNAATEDGIDNADTTFLRSLLKLQVMRVISVEDTGRDEPVVDLEIEGDHEYQTGPILSHNSSDVVTATWIDKGLSERGIARIQCLKTRDDQPFETFYVGIDFNCRKMFTVRDVTEAEAQTAGNNLDKNLLDD